MSEAEVKLHEPTKQDILGTERTRLAALLFEKSVSMTNDYKVLLKHTGGLLSNSMVFAYSKAFNDCIKLILKENQGENNVKK